MDTPIVITIDFLSTDGTRTYRLTLSREGARCTCPGFYFVKHCKHATAGETFARTLRLFDSLEAGIAKRA